MQAAVTQRAERPNRPSLTIAMTLFAAALLALLPNAPADAAVDRAAEEELICSLNDARRSEGLPPLRVNSDLTRVARAHSVVMGNRSHLHHNPNLAGDVTNWRVVGENVGRGPSAGALHRALMNSPGHRANILHTRYTDVGIGVERRGSTLWITQVFRLPRSSTSGTVPSCGADTTRVASSGGVPISGDWNGDGRTTPGRFIDGRWELSNSLAGNADITFSFGRRGDVPVTGDWNGDGVTTVGIVRNDTWYLRNGLSAGNAHHVFRYGRRTRGDVPITGDWNANGRDTIGIIRDGEWHLRNSLTGGPGQIVFTYGRVVHGDVPVTGDWNRNGRDGIGIIRGAEWHLRDSLSGGGAQVRFTW